MLKKNGQLIEQVLGENMVEPFKRLNPTEQEKVTEFVENIQVMLEDDAKNLCKWVGSDPDYVLSDHAWSWVNYICGALCGYLLQSNQDCDVVRFIQRECVDIAPLILVFALCDKTGDNGKRMERVKKCIDYLYQNMHKFGPTSGNILPDLNDLMGAIKKLKGDKCDDLLRIHGEQMIGCYSYYSVIDMYLIARIPDLQSSTNLQSPEVNSWNLSFKCGENILTFVDVCCGNKFKYGLNSFEILKDGKSIGTFSLENCNFISGFPYLYKKTREKNLSTAVCGYDCTSGTLVTGPSDKN